MYEQVMVENCETSDEETESECGSRMVVVMFTKRTLDDPFAAIEAGDEISAVDMQLSLDCIKKIEQARERGDLVPFITEDGTIRVHPRNIYFKDQ